VQRRPARLAKGSSRLRSSFCMAMAVSRACVAWSVSGTGAPQKAMIASPMYLSIVPRFSCTFSVIAVR